MRKYYVSRDDGTMKKHIVTHFTIFLKAQITEIAAMRGTENVNMILYLSNPENGLDFMVQGY